MVHTELYDVLGIKPDATANDIKAAYKEMARKYHPDKNKDPGAEDMFKKINAANEILSDPEKKATYDKFGLEGFEQHGGEGMDPFDIFNMMRPQQRRAFQVECKITLADYFTKKSMEVTYQRDLKCDTCDATGFADKISHKCTKCNGTGVVMQTLRQGPMIQQFQTQCPLCRGKKVDSNSAHKKCTTCNGHGAKQHSEKIMVNVPQNILVDPRAIVNGQGPWIDGKYIDLAVLFKLDIPKNFAVTSDRKLIYTMHINLTETLCGFRRSIDHPSGKKILMVSEKNYVIDPYNIYVLDRMGFNNGPMYVTFVVHYPERIKSGKDLESMLGARYEPNATDNIDPQYVYVLSSLEKINNNPYTKKDQDDSDDESIPHGFNGMPGGFPGGFPGGAQHVQECSQQ